MRSSGWTIAIVLIFAALTIANVMYYSNRVRELNNIPLRTNPLGGDPYRIGSQAEHDRQTQFWIFEGALVVICGAVWLIASAPGRKPAS
jgi:hypothetical protein